MKTLQKVGGISALVCAGTSILALGLLTTVLTPMADGSLPFDQFIAFFLPPHQTLVFIWHFSMYLVNGTFLAVLTLALYQRLKTGTPALIENPSFVISLYSFPINSGVTQLIEGSPKIRGWGYTPTPLFSVSFRELRKSYNY